MNDLTFVDLFSGAGGLSIGLEQSGFKSILALDNEKSCVLTYKKNHPNTKVILGNIENLSPKKIKNQINKNVFLLAGGPPCQGFSTANRHNKFIDDPRNKLYKYFIQNVNELKPKFVLMENVFGILKIENQIKEDFEKIDYYVESVVLNARDYGIPQNRKRVIFIASNKKNKTRVNKIIKKIVSHKEKKIVPLKDALWGLRKLEAKKEKNNTQLENKKTGFFEDVLVKINQPPKYILDINNGNLPSKIFNHISRYNNERDIEIFHRLPQGANSEHSSIKDIMPYASRNHMFKDKYYKLNNNEICKTITAHMKFDCNMYIHPNQARGLTPREAARIQSFPDEYQFYGPFTKWYLQIGNAVPPRLAFIIGKSIISEVVRHD